MLRLLSVIILLFFVLSPSLFATTTVNDINKIIKEKGALWKAEDNWVWSSNPHEKSMMMGAESAAPKVFEFYSEVSDEKSMDAIPDELDWRNFNGKNYMSPVTNQGKCGSCVAFATIATFEGQVNVANNWPGLDMNFSEQHIWACGGGTCDRGWTTNAGASFLKTKGVPDEACFPYFSGANGEDLACRESCGNVRERIVKIRNYSSVGGWYSNNRDVMTALQNGPLMARMTVYDDFPAYKSGIYQHVTGGVLGGHAITIVGYNNVEKYWIIKNSWGEEWGENGYFRIRMDDDSNVSGFLRLSVDPFEGAARIKSPAFREIISGNYIVEMENSFKSVNGMEIELEKNGVSYTYLAAKEDGLYRAAIDTTKLEDGVYLARAVAFLDKGNRIERAKSLYKRFFVLNGIPSIQVAMHYPADGAVLKERIYIDLTSSAQPIPVEKLVLMIKNEAGDIQEVINENSAPRTLIGFRTYLFPNGQYEIWGEARIGTHKVATDHINVTVSN